MYNSIQWWWERNWWHIEIDSKGRLRTKPCDKRDDFNFPIVNFPEAPAHRACISQLIRYFRAGGSYHRFFDRGLLLTRKLLNQWFLLVKLKSSLWMFYGWPLWYIDLCHKWPRIYVPLVVNISRSFPHSWLKGTGFVTRLTRRVSLVEQELLTIPEHLSSPPVFSGVRVIRSLILYVCFVDSCLSLSPFPLVIVLFRYTDSDYLPLVSSNSSYNRCNVTQIYIRIFKVWVQKVEMINLQFDCILHTKFDTSVFKGRLVCFNIQIVNWRRSERSKWELTL